MSARICAAANALISNNRDRMKQGREIRVDRRRRDDHPGGRWEELDAHGRGRVEVLALLRRRRDDGDPAYRDRYRADIWEYPLVEIVWRGDDIPLHGRSSAPIDRA